ncbi:IS200/IS605 family element RNA-guided endonuclease TnpB [Spirosoma montaniterrae]|uniref:Transposase n=1 Tax=Spirosoma montaniterrae TaxID=1178516 RepID=A0A1P9X568_9BACT|nr:IS200/IS605 family element RNA-guided endonuclease TnpB [Spirosoma montaniterrae]AQG82683.1 transposase [Spirosoma montaniterrae]
MPKAYRYRLYPNAAQADLLNRHFGSVRYLYNWALAKKTQAYQTENKALSRYDIQRELPNLKGEQQWLKEINSQALQSALLNLDSAYTRFFREKKGFPRFKSKKDSRHSFQCPQNVKVDFSTSTIQLPKIGKVKAVLSREFVGTIKTVTVSKSATGKVFASVLVETTDVLPAKSAPNQALAVGIDVGLKDFATLSTGEAIANPRFLKKSLKKLRRLSRQHSKKQKGSSNRNKSRVRLARQHERVSNQRTDFLHKVSTRIVRENQTVCVESLNISGLLKNTKLSRAIADVSWGSFVSMLEYKCEWQGKNLVKIGRFEPSSKLCTCGTLNHALTLKDRVWTCSACGTTHNRDLLAANNIVRFAFQKQNLIGVDSPESALVETAVR